MKSDDLLWFIAGTVVPSLLTSWLATWAMRRIAPAVGLMDKPNARKVHVTPMPMGGGLGIWLGLMIPFAAGSLALRFLLQLDPADQAWVPEMVLQHLPGLENRLPSLWVLLLGATVLTVLGLLDDRI